MKASFVALIIGWIFRRAFWTGFLVFTQHSAILQSPVYQSAVQIAKSSPELQRTLGPPIEESGFTLGQIGEAPQIGFTQWSAGLKGAKGSGNLYGVANRLGNDWDYSRLVFVPANGQDPIDLTTPPRAELLELADAVRQVYLVALDPAAEQMIAWAPHYYKLRLDLEVAILPAMSLSLSELNPDRQQVVAEKALAAMRRAHPALADDPGAVLIGITTQDMYIEAYSWPYATNLRSLGSAVISTARLEPFSDLARWDRGLLFFLLMQDWNKELVRSRLQKLLSKNIYVLCFDLPLSDDPTSVLAFGPRTGAEIDVMTNEIIGAAGRWYPSPSAGDPNVSVIVDPGKPTIWRFDGHYGSANASSFVADLRLGLLIYRRTDFALKAGFEGDTPLWVARAYRNRDNQPRAFGIGTNHSLDIFLAGKMNSYIDLIYNDGSREHFVKDPSARGQVYRPPADASSNFTVAVFEQNVWRLTTWSGWTYIFPYKPQASGSKVTILTGFTSPTGDHFEMVRNEAGDLLFVNSPEGTSLRFQYDSQHRVTQISDSRNSRTLSYAYDSSGRLARMEDSEGGGETYSYDDENQMTAVHDLNGKPLLTNSYSADRFITGQTLGDGRRFAYTYHRDDAGNLVYSTVADPAGYVTRLDFSPNSYTRSLPKRAE
jgi:YD repeat-containing protein